MRRKLTDAEKVFIHDNYHNLTPNEIAISINCHPSTIYSYLTNNKLNYKRVKGKEVTLKERKVILENYRDLSARQIALMINRPLQTIYTLLSREGISKRA